MVAQNCHRPRCLAGSFTSKMAAARIWNDSWKEDLNLRQKLKDYVTEGLRRKEILDFMLRDYDCHTWSIRTLDRHLQYCNMRYKDTDVAVDEVKEAIMQEIEGPGRLPGYRAMQEKLRQVHNLGVPGDLVHAVMMYNVDPILGDPGAVSRVERKGVTKVFNYGTKETFVWLAVRFCSVQSPHRAKGSKQRWLPKPKSSDQVKSSFDRSFRMAWKGLQSVMSFS